MGIIRFENTAAYKTNYRKYFANNFSAFRAINV